MYYESSVQPKWHFWIEDKANQLHYHYFWLFMLWQCDVQTKANQFSGCGARHYTLSNFVLFHFCFFGKISLSKSIVNNKFYEMEMEEEH